MKKYENTYWGIDDYIYAVQQYMVTKGMFLDDAIRETYALSWWISTGRAGAESISRLLQKQPFVIARVLMKGGSIQEQVDNIKRKIGVKREV